MSKKTKITLELSKKVYVIEGILIIGWIAYLTKFYLFYKEAYFYVDKRMSLFLRLLSFLDNNWTESMYYFLVGFLLLSGTCFFNGILYLFKKKNFNQTIVYGLGLINSLFCLALLFNVVGAVFLILTILSASLAYIIFTLGKNSSKEISAYEQDDVIEVIGPFATEEAAQKEAHIIIESWVKEETLLLNAEIYTDTDSQYYAEIYIEAINQSISL